MKKGDNICLTIFSSLLLVTLILLMSALATLINNYYNSVEDILIASEALILISVIGTFISSIVCLAKCKHFQRKELIKVSSNVGIVGSSIGFIFAILGLGISGIDISAIDKMTTLIAPMLFVSMVLTFSFGISIGALVRINREINDQSC